MSNKEDFLLNLNADDVGYVKNNWKDQYLEYVNPIFLRILKASLNSELINFLLQKGAKIGETDENQFPLIHVIVLYSKVDIAKDFLNKHKEEVNISTKNGDSLLHSAVKRNDIDIIKQIIEIGLDVNTKNEDGWTALDFAYLVKNEEIIEELQNAGAIRSDTKEISKWQETMDSLKLDNKERQPINSDIFTKELMEILNEYKGTKTTNRDMRKQIDDLKHKIGDLNVQLELLKQK